MKRFNEWLAVKLTEGVGTMYCAYGFALLAILGFPKLLNGAGIYVSWVSQTFIQLTMLSVIMVGQSIQAQKHKKTHDQIAKIHKHLGIKEE